MENYNYKKIEKKWQGIWEKNKEKIDNKSKKEEKYILDMFPYPSGVGLHVGHVEGYTATDIYSRFLSMQKEGYDVIHPMGWDAFGLPAENYAIKTKTHPNKSTHENIANFTKQMKSIGFKYNWERELDSSSPEYYKWTQWFFLFFYKNDLAYKKKSNVNWCEKCKTVLANEQAEGGKCERCESEVIQKTLEQWFFKITDFIEDQKYEGKNIKGLLSGLNDIDWPDSTKAAQKNWIGRSEGVEVNFKINNEKVAVFTTRPDTLFGATYFVLSPEHEIVERYKDKISNWNEVQSYIKEAQKKTDLERTDLNKDKSGVKLEGVNAINPVNNEEISVFIADYVLSGYGTGAIMAVPAHDERDWEFAKKYDLPIKQVVATSCDFGDEWNEDYTCTGKAVNSEFLDGLETTHAKKKIIEWLGEKKLGKKTINYKMRDWLISRQRYWGAPIPIIYCETCGEVPVSEKDLPVELPTDVDFMPTGESPLKKSKTFHDVKCPKCGMSAKRESDTMDTFVCSSWYYMRFADPKNNKEFASKEALKKWLPVDTYVGGAEHTVLHLLYSRFFTKVLQKYGYVDFNEPFSKLRHQGIILAEDGTKMSKSKGNVINPDDVVKVHGADALRMYEMFMGPLEDMKPWNMKGIVGITRFLDKIWKISEFKNDKNSNETESLLHRTIKKVTKDINSFKFNTAISQMMILVNAVEKEKKISKEFLKKFLIILAPFAPHIAEEIWSKLPVSIDGTSVKSRARRPAPTSIFDGKNWPEYDENLAKDDKIELVIQVNGKVRERIEVDAEISEDDVKRLASESETIKKWIKDKKIVKEIFVKGKLLNIVVK